MNHVDGEMGVRKLVLRYVVEINGVQLEADPNGTCMKRHFGKKMKRIEMKRRENKGEQNEKQEKNEPEEKGKELR